MLASPKIFLLLLITVAICQRVRETKRYNVITLDKDLPLKSDLHGLLASLRRIIKYSFKRKTDIDVNLAFGLFLIHVNLRSCLETNKELPTVLRNDLHYLLIQNDELLQYVKQRTPDDTDSEEINSLHITPLLNELSWVNHLERFKQVRSNEPIFRSGSHSGRNDLDWQDYLERMPDYDRWTPNPKTSDYCIRSLVGSQKTPELKCEVSQICHHMLRNGTNFGYALTHRLLFLVQARSGRGCSIYSPTLDERIRHELCGRAYEEAEYIAIHDYDFIDLMLEQIALCSLDGHSEFLHRSWLSRLLRHQAPHGCFGEYPQRLHTRRPKHRSFKIKHNFVESVCNSHVTGVAAATLGAAVRFIIEMYYD